MEETTHMEDCAIALDIPTARRSETPSQTGGASGHVPSRAQAGESRAAKFLRELFESGRPLTYLRTTEEQRVGWVLREVGQRLLPNVQVPVWSWSLTDGLRRGDEPADSGLGVPRNLLEFIAELSEAAIFHLKD